jgi:membrane protease YdiL (CAAX protease family)
VSSALWWTAGVVLAAVAWLNTGALPVPARAWTAILLVALPALMIVQARQLRQLGDLPRTAAYVSSIASLWLLAGISVLVAHYSGMTLADLGFHPAPLLRTVAWTALLTLTGIAILFLFHWLGARETSVLRSLLPVTRAERRLFAAVSITAGVCEETVCRGFLLTALVLATGSVTLAVLLSSSAFGVVHAYQHPVGALRVAVLGACLSLPLATGDSILPAIAAHTAIDLLSGLWLARYLLR